MSWLLDTSLLVRFADSTAAQHQTARVAIEALVGRGEDVYLTSQNLIEFWAVATRPVIAGRA
jgi:predicted nucleic acid-binding protein